MTAIAESARRFPCFGGSVGVYVGCGELDRGRRAAARAERRLLEIHARLSRFLPESELSLLNRDPRERVPASDLMLRFAGAIHAAGALSYGLVDASCLPELIGAGYSESIEPDPSDLSVHGSGPSGERRPAGADPDERWRAVGVDEAERVVIRPPGLELDSGGIAKGMAADLIGADLRGFQSWAVDCGGDMLIGGRTGAARQIEIADPLGGPPLHRLELSAGAIATSGIGRRSWRSADGSLAHHLIDPGTGLPAFTGIIQATALARTCFEAEVLAKTALLSGPERGAEKLIHGGLLVLDDGSIELVQATRTAIAA